MVRSLEIYFDDLNEAAKKNYLEFKGVESAEDLNTENDPIFVVDHEDELDPDLI